MQVCGHLLVDGRYRSYSPIFFFSTGSERSESPSTPQLFHAGSNTQQDSTHVAPLGAPPPCGGDTEAQMAGFKLKVGWQENRGEQHPEIEQGGHPSQTQEMNSVDTAFANGESSGAIVGSEGGATTMSEPILSL